MTWRTHTVALHRPVTTVGCRGGGVEQFGLLSRPRQFKLNCGRQLRTSGYMTPHNVQQSKHEDNVVALTAALQRELSALRNTRRALDEERAQLGREAQCITRLLAQHDDLVELNVSGELIAASRKTLCQVPGSLLASMFSGRWEDALVRDSQGRVFLDFNPAHFRAIMNALQRCSHQPPGCRVWQAATAGIQQSEEVLELMDYLRLHHSWPAKLQLAGGVEEFGAVVIDNDGSTARCGTSSTQYHWGCVLSSMPLPGPLCTWRLRVLSVADGFGWVYLGVVSAADGMPEPGAGGYSEANSFGWGGINQEYQSVTCFSAGVSMRQAGWDGFAAGDCVTMTLDVSSCNLRMQLQRPTSETRLSIALPADAAARRWYFDFNIEGDPIDTNSGDTAIRLESCSVWA